MGDWISKGKGCIALSQGDTGSMMAALRRWSFSLLCSHWRKALVVSGSGAKLVTWNMDGIQMCDQVCFKTIAIPYMIWLLVSSKFFLVFVLLWQEAYKWPLKIILPYSPNTFCLETHFLVKNSVTLVKVKFSFSSGSFENIYKWGS